MGADVPVRHAAGHPHGAFFLFSLADEFHDPYFVRVGDGKRLALRIVAVFLHQGRHDLDGFPGRGCALQGDVDQAPVVQDAVGAAEFRTAAEGRFGDGDLFFVHVADDVVRLPYLRDLSQQVPGGIPFIDIEHRPRAVFGGRVVVQLAEHLVRIGRIGQHRAAIFGSAFGNQQVGARRRSRGCAEHRQQQGQAERSIFHSLWSCMDLLDVLFF